MREHVQDCSDMGSALAVVISRLLQFVAAGLAGVLQSVEDGAAVPGCGQRISSMHAKLATLRIAAADTWSLPLSDVPQEPANK